MTKNQKAKRGSKKKLVLIVLLIVIILAGGAFAGWWFWWKPTHETVSELPWKPTAQDYKNAQNSYVKQQQEQKAKVDSSSGATSAEKQQANVNLAEGYGFAGDYDKAIAVYDTILGDPASSLRYDQWMVMGKFYALGGQMDKAKQALDKAEQQAEAVTDPEERFDDLHDVANYRQEYLK